MREFTVGGASSARVARANDYSPLQDALAFGLFLSLPDIWGHHTQFKTEISKVFPE